MHTLIVGKTISGKTTLAKQLVTRYSHMGFSSLVHDIHLSDWGQLHDYRIHVTDNDEHFLNLVWNSNRCIVVVDEASEKMSRAKIHADFVKIATRGRHRGHHGIFIAQELTRLHYSVVAQCPRIAVFQLTSHEATKLAVRVGSDDVLRAPDFEVGEFCWIEPNKESIMINMFNAGEDEKDG